MLARIMNECLTFFLKEIRAFLKYPVDIELAGNFSGCQPKNLSCCDEGPKMKSYPDRAA